MDLEEKSDRQLLFANTEVDVGGPIYWPSDNRIIGSNTRPTAHTASSSTPRPKSLYAAIDHIRPDADNEIVDSPADGKRCW